MLFLFKILLLVKLLFALWLLFADVKLIESFNELFPARVDEVAIGVADVDGRKRTSISLSSDESSLSSLKNLIFF